LHENGDSGDDDEEQYPEEDEDEEGGEPMTLAQLMSGGGHIHATVPPEADLADIEDVFGQDNANMMLEDADDEDGDDDEGAEQGTLFCSDSPLCL
jgi:hypothetical protein